MDTRSLETANERLREEFVNYLPAATVDEAFHQSTDELTQVARVDNFVPLLAERRARERLMALARS